jgi:hypothetical protein
MSNSRKRLRPHANAGSNGIVTREHGQRRLRKATTLTIAGAIAITGVTTALASQVPSRHSASRTSSGGVASSAAAIAAAQQAASTVSASNTASSSSNSGSSGSTSTPSSSQGAPVASSGGS